jgi:hypothetical protein
MINWLLGECLIVCLLFCGCSGSGWIAGKILDSVIHESVPEANVFVKGTNWGVVADSMGYYVIKHVPRGVYTVVSSRWGYHASTLLSVKVEKDKVSIVNFRLCPNGIPEEQFPWEWEKNDSSMIPIDIFTK